MKRSSVGKGDVVFEIGAGQGIITRELVNRCWKIVAFEIDQNLHRKLKEKFKSIAGKVELRSGDFLDCPLPGYKYKVFSNIPFSVTADLVRKLVFSKNPPLDAYLIVQKEAAEKFTGQPLGNQNSLMSTLIKTRFKIEILHEFKRSDFYPKPSVKVVMLRIKLTKKPLLPAGTINLFYDFVTYAYGQFKPNILKGLKGVVGEQGIKQAAEDGNFSVFSKPSQLKIGHWVALFEKFLKQSRKTRRDKIKGSFKKLQKQQSKLQKIHRTRADKTWKQHGFPFHNQ